MLLPQITIQQGTIFLKTYFFLACLLTQTMWFHNFFVGEIHPELCNWHDQLLQAFHDPWLVSFKNQHSFSEEKFMELFEQQGVERLSAGREGFGVECRELSIFLQMSYLGSAIVLPMILPHRYQKQHSHPKEKL